MERAGKLQFLGTYTPEFPYAFCKTSPDPIIRVSARKIHIGFSPETLNLTIDFHRQGSVKGIIPGKTPYTFYVPLFGEKIYIQLEWADGKRTDVKAMKLTPHVHPVYYHSQPKGRAARMTASTEDSPEVLGAFNGKAEYYKNWLISPAVVGIALLIFLL